MSEDVSGNECPFDLERLREVIEMMEQHGLSEVSLARGDEKTVIWFLVRRGSPDRATWVDRRSQEGSGDLRSGCWRGQETCAERGIVISPIPGESHCRLVGVAFHADL